MTDPYPSRTQRETFAIARELAVSTSERDAIDQLLQQLVLIGRAETEAIASIRSARRARGEKVRELNLAENAAIDDLADPGLEPGVRDYLTQLPAAADVLRSIAHGHALVLPLRKANLRYHHPDDRPIEEALIGQWNEFLESVFDFIGDATWRREMEWLVAKQLLSQPAAGGAIFIVLDGAAAIAEIDGKALAKNFDRLETIAGTLGLTPFSAFFGIGGSGSQDWFDPGQGIATAAGLTGEIKLAACKIKGKQALLADLQAFVDVLQHARSAAARFHIEVDV